MTYSETRDYLSSMDKLELIEKWNEYCDACDDPNVKHLDTANYAQYKDMDIKQLINMHNLAMYFRTEY